MANEVPAQRPSATRIIYPRGEQLPPTKLRTFLGKSITYGPFTALYVTSWVALFAFQHGWPLWAWLPVNYVVIGAVWGFTLWPRRSIRRFLRTFGNHVKGSGASRVWGMDTVLRQDVRTIRSEWPDDFGGVLGLITGTLYLMFAYAISWPLLALYEIHFWSEFHD